MVVGHGELEHAFCIGEVQVGREMVIVCVMGGGKRGDHANGER